MARDFLSGLGNLLEKPEMVSALEALSGARSGGGPALPVSENLTVPFGLTFDQQQQVRRGALEQDVTAESVKESRARTRAEAERLALDRRRADLEARSVEHQIAQNDLSESEEQAAMDERAKEERKSRETQKAADRTLQLESQALSQEFQAGQTAAEIESRERIAAERAAATASHNARLQQASTERTALALAQYDLAIAQAEADAAANAAVGPLGATPDTIAKWQGVMEKAQDIGRTWEEGEYVGEETQAARSEYLNLLALKAGLVGYKRGEVPLEIILGHVPEKHKATIIEYDQVMQSGNPEKIREIHNRAVREFNAAIERSQQEVAEAEAVGAQAPSAVRESGAGAPELVRLNPDFSTGDPVADSLVKIRGSEPPEEFDMNKDDTRRSLGNQIFIPPAGMF